MHTPILHKADLLKTILVATIVTLSACNATTPTDAASKPAAPAAPTPAAAEPAPQSPATPASTPPADTTPPADNAMPAFADKVWRVQEGSGVEAGTTYTFHSGGVLVIDAPHGTPMTGSWTYVDGKLTMTEEGIAYPTDIVLLDAGHFTIRSHNPGGTLEIAMDAVPGAVLPAAATN